MSNINLIYEHDRASSTFVRLRTETAILFREGTTLYLWFTIFDHATEERASTHHEAEQ